ncbi:MAG: restriction endonuclease [Firmicutes bacterium HGW-Firmicutes-15]|nr:MAG: restriction endonuclease [Firmicutes bacterium HGW-Firmicutes-15]
MLKMVRFGDAFMMRKGIKAEETERTSTSIRYIQIDDLRNDNHIKYCGNNPRYVKATERDIVIAWDGANAGTSNFGLVGAIGSTLAVLKTEVKEIYTPYVGLLIKSKFRFLRGNCTGATIPHLNRAVVEEIQIPIHPMEVQQQIAQTLEKASQLISLRKKQLEELDNLMKSIFCNMFGDLVTNEKGWESHLLGDISEIVSGITKGRKLSTTNTISMPYMRVANVKDGYLDLGVIKYIDISERELKQFALEIGDVLLTEGGDPDKLGRGAVWKGQIEKCIHQNHIFRVRIKNANINSVYLSMIIGSNYGKKYFFRAAKQTTGIASINMTQLKKFPVLIPPFDLQTQFAAIVEKIEEQKLLVQKAMDESQHLFDGLMDKFFGE